MHGDTTKEATIDEDGGEESGGAKDIFEDVDVMKYLKEGEVKPSGRPKREIGFSNTPNGSCRRGLIL
jgi:hypothetical protein